MNNNTDVVIAPGNSYFLHVTFAGEELRFSREQPIMLDPYKRQPPAEGIDRGFVLIGTGVRQDLAPGSLPQPLHESQWKG